MDKINKQLYMDDMMKSIYMYPNGTSFIIEFEYGNVIIYGFIDTMYETNNDFDEEDDEYAEYYACSFKIERVIKNLSSKNYKTGTLMEISRFNQPTLIVNTQNNRIVWNECKD